MFVEGGQFSRPPKLEPIWEMPLKRHFDAYELFALGGQI
jgi:hypothetical protein